MEQASSRRRNLLRLNTHFVWTTKNRLPLIDTEYERSLYRYIEKVFLDYGGTVLAIGGMPDHIHILVALVPKHGISEVIKNVKGSSSRFVSTKLKAGEWFGWQPNYAAINVSPSDVETIKHYILNQKQHHASGTILQQFEEVDEPDIS